MYVCLSLRGKLYKTLRKKTEKYLHNLGFGNGFLSITSKAQTTREKIEKLDLLKNLNLYIKRFTEKSERTPME